MGARARTDGRGRRSRARGLGDEVGAGRPRSLAGESIVVFSQFEKSDGRGFWRAEEDWHRGRGVGPARWRWGKQVQGRLCYRAVRGAAEAGLYRIARQASSTVVGKGGVGPWRSANEAHERVRPCCHVCQKESSGADLWSFLGRGE